MLGDSLILGSLFVRSVIYGSGEYLSFNKDIFLELIAALRTKE